MINFLKKVVRKLFLVPSILTGRFVAIAGGLKNKIFWKLYYNRWMIILEGCFKNKKIYFTVFTKTLLNKLVGRKVVIVFLLSRSHYTWVKGIVSNIKSSANTKFLFFSPSCFHEQLSDCKYSTKDITPTRCLQVLPTIWADMYMTPSSATTDNIQISAPKVVFLHSLVSIHGVYEDNSFDGYDYVYCAGKHHVEEFTQLFESKGLTGKCLIPGGYPKLDEQIEKANLESRTEERCVIIAPTLLSKATENSSLLYQADSLIQWFLNNQFSVIFRPHPLNLERSNEYSERFESLIGQFIDHDSFELDKSPDYSYSYARAKFMVSDISGTAYTFAFGYLKPILYVRSSNENNFTQGLLYKERMNLGQEIFNSREIPKAVTELLDNYAGYQKSVVDVRDNYIYNIGSSSEYLSENFEYLLTGKKHADWIYI